MSPQIAVDERLRRLAPISTGGAAFGLAVLRARAGGLSEREVIVCGALALAAALVAHAIATLRGSVGVIAGVVAGLWLAAAAAASTTAAAAAAAAAAITAVLALVLARADKLESAPPIATAPAAVALIIVEPRAWALVAVIAVLVAWRDGGRRRWMAAAPAIAAVVGGILTLLAVMGKSPAWAPGVARVGGEAWMNDVVDTLGPVAIVVGAIGVIVAIEDRRARWTAAAIVGSLVAAVPLSASVPGVAIVGLAMAIGMSVAAVSVRVGRMRQQALVGLAVAAVLVVHAVI